MNGKKGTMNGKNYRRNNIINELKEFVKNNNFFPIVKKNGNSLIINNCKIYSLKEENIKYYKIYYKNNEIKEKIYNPLIAIMIGEILNFDNKDSIEEILNLNREYISKIDDINRLKYLIKKEKNKINCSNEKIDILTTKMESIKEKLFYVENKIKKKFKDTSKITINLNDF